MSRTFCKHARRRVCLKASPPKPRQPVASRSVKNNTTTSGSCWFEQPSYLSHVWRGFLYVEPWLFSSKLQRIKLVLHRDTSNSILSWMDIGDRSTCRPFPFTGEILWHHMTFSAIRFLNLHYGNGFDFASPLHCSCLTTATPTSNTSKYPHWLENNAIGNATNEPKRPPRFLGPW